MSVYWLSFKIKEINVGGRTSDRRRSELYSMVDAMVIPNGDPTLVWKDTTSFVVFKSGRNISEIASKLKSIISQHHDLFFIRNMDIKSAKVCGKLDNDELFKMMLNDKNRTYLEDITDKSAMSEARKLSASLRAIDEIID